MDVAQGSALLHFTRNGNFGAGGAELLVLERGEGAYVFDTHGKPLRRRALEPVLRADRLLLRRGDGRGRGAAAAAARLQHAVGHGAPAGARAGRPARRARARRASIACSSPPAARSPSRRPGSSSRQYHVANGAAAAAQGDRPQHRLPRRHARAPWRFTGVPGYKEPFGPPAIDTRHVSNTNAFRSRAAGRGADRAAAAARSRTAILEEGPETVAMIIAEPVQNAGGCLVPPPGYWQGLREIADRYGILLRRRRGDHRLRAARRVVRRHPLRRHARPHHGRQGAHVGLRADGRRAGLRDASPRRCTRTSARCCTASPSAATRCAPRSRSRTSRSSSARACSRTCAPARTDLRAAPRGAAGDLPIVGDVRGDGFFWAVELVKDEDNDALRRRRARAAAARLTCRRRLLEAGPDRARRRPRRLRPPDRAAADLRRRGAR